MEKQEIRKLIREALNSNENRYITKDVSLELYLSNILGEDDYFDSTSKATVEWGLDIEEKSYGITNFKPIIYKITLNAQIWREKLQDLEEMNRVIDFKEGISHGDTFEGFKININEDTGSRAMFPVEISVSDSYNSIDVTFEYP